MAETITEDKRKESRTLQLSDEQMRGVAGGFHSATASKQEQTWRHRTCPAIATWKGGAFANTETKGKRLKRVAQYHRRGDSEQT